uniref:Uncharacterized protein n=1 Tax=Amphiprion ocellaris TaxID=80972 RepID=A0A3Q1C1Y9_AMPOC
MTERLTFVFVVGIICCIIHGWCHNNVLCSGPCAVGAVALAPVALGAIGFTSAGIAAGSYAAGMMSTAALANGGGVAAGSLVAVLQSAGTFICLLLTFLTELKCAFHPSKFHVAESCTCEFMRTQIC